MGTRRYDSSGRREQAERTRERIRRSAAELFAADGFAATTVAAIADRAGVSAPTVYAAFGSKAALATAIVESMEESSEAAHWRRLLAEEDDPRHLLGHFASWTGAFFTASRPQLLAMSAQAEGLALAAEGDRHRRDAVESLVQRLVTARTLRPDLTPAAAADRIWMLTGLSIYQAATAGCGWSPEEYAHWLGATLCDQVLVDPAPTD